MGELVDERRRETEREREREREIGKYIEGERKKEKNTWTKLKLIQLISCK